MCECFFGIFGILDGHILNPIQELGFLTKSSAGMYPRTWFTGDKGRGGSFSFGFPEIKSEICFFYFFSRKPKIFPVLLGILNRYKVKNTTK